MISPSLPGAEDGLVLHASGRRFLRLAHKLAESLRLHMAGWPVDLFTDDPLDAPAGAFSQVHIDPAFGPSGKIAAIRASRFARSIYLDVDMLAVAPFEDVFAVLDGADLALVHDQLRASPACQRIWRMPIPAAFPQVNGGLVAWHTTPKTDAFFAAWQDAVAAHGIGRDQPALRELLWLDQELRMRVLPEEYNFWDPMRIDSMTYRHAAPRLLHNIRFKDPEIIEMDPEQTLVAVLGHRRRARLDLLLQGDATRGAHPPEAAAHYGYLSPRERLRLLWTGRRDLPAALRRLLAYPSK